MTHSIQSPRPSTQPTSLDSKLGIPILAVDDLMKLTEVNSLVFCSFYKDLSKQNEIVTSIYLEFLRNSEQEFNENYEKKISNKEKEFTLLRSELKDEEPECFGFQKGQMIAQMEQELLHEELVSQFGKMYFGNVPLKVNGIFTKDRWLAVLFNQYLPDHENTLQQREFYYRQIIEADKSELLMKSVVNFEEKPPNFLSVFLDRAVDYLKKKRLDIFSKRSTQYEYGKIDSIRKVLLELESHEKNVVLTDACIDCCKNFANLRAGYIQKIYQLAKSGGSHKELKEVGVEEGKNHLITIESNCNKIIQAAKKKTTTFIPLARLTPENMESLKEVSKKCFIEIDKGSKSVTDFVFLLNLYYPEKNSCAPFKEYREIFEQSLRILKSFNANGAKK